jgi:hypothetical protein
MAQENVWVLSFQVERAQAILRKISQVERHNDLRPTSDGGGHDVPIFLFTRHLRNEELITCNIGVRERLSHLLYEMLPLNFVIPRVAKEGGLKLVQYVL